MNLRVPGTIGMAVFALIASFVPGMPRAQESFPLRPIRVIVPFPAGASADLSARAIGQRVAESLGQQIVIENRPGGNTIIAADIAAHSKPDGYTLIQALDTTMTLIPIVYHSAPFDPERDFAPVTQTSRSSYVLAARANAPYKTLNELVAYARQNPGKMNIGASTVLTQLLALLLKRSAGIDVVYVPYKGSPPMIQGLMASELDLTIDAIPLYVPPIKAGKLAPLANTGSARALQLPDTPTVRESGYPQLEANTWTGLFAPAATPEAIVRRLNSAFVHVLDDAEFRRHMLERGLNPVTSSTPAELALLVKDGLSKWAPLVKALGIKPE